MVAAARGTIRPATGTLNGIAEQSAMNGQLLPQSGTDVFRGQQGISSGWPAISASVIAPMDMASSAGVIALAGTNDPNISPMTASSAST